MAHPLEGKKQIKGTVPGKDLMSDLLIKDVKIIVWNTFEELKEDVEKVKKMMCEQNRNINGEKENLKKLQNWETQ